MRSALMAAAAALSLSVFLPAPALAQDSGDQANQMEHAREWRGGRERERGDNDNGQGRGRGEWRNNDQAPRQVENNAPPPERPREAPSWRPNNQGGPQGGDVAVAPDARERGDRNGRPEWNGGVHRPPVGEQTEVPRNRPPGPPNNEWNGGAGPRDGGGRPEWNGERRPPGSGDWRTPRDGGGGLEGGRDGDRGRGDWNNGDRGRGDWNNGGRRPPGVGERPPVGGNGDRGRDHDWDRDRRGGDRDRGDWGRDDRGHNDRGRDWGRGWRADDHNYRDWNNHRHDDRYRPYWNTHRDFSRPRYNDWRNIRHGYYFDGGYAWILRAFYSHDYYGWNYPNWRRPYRDYRVGYELPYWIDWYEVPWDLYYRLPPAPYGCRYIMVDRDILLISLATGIVLDAMLYY